MAQKEPQTSTHWGGFLTPADIHRRDRKLKLLYCTDLESLHNANYSEWNAELMDACTIEEVDWILTQDGTKPTATDNRTVKNCVLKYGHWLKINL